MPYKLLKKKRRFNLLPQEGHHPIMNKVYLLCSLVECNNSNKGFLARHILALLGEQQFSKEKKLWGRVFFSLFCIYYFFSTKGALPHRVMIQLKFSPVGRRSFKRPQGPVELGGRGVFAPPPPNLAELQGNPFLFKDFVLLIASPDFRLCCRLWTLMALLRVAFTHWSKRNIELYFLDGGSLVKAASTATICCREKS